MARVVASVGVAGGGKCWLDCSGTMTSSRWRVRIPLFLCLGVVAWFTWHSGPAPRPGARQATVAAPELPGSFDEVFAAVLQHGLAGTIDVSFAFPPDRLAAMGWPTAGSARIDTTAWTHEQRECLVNLVLWRASRPEPDHFAVLCWLMALDDAGFFGLLHVPRLLQERLWSQGPAVAISVGRVLYRLAVASGRYECAPAAIELSRRHMLADDARARVAFGVLLAVGSDGDANLDELLAKVEAGERLPTLQMAAAMLRIGHWVGGERLWALVENWRRSSASLPPSLLPLVVAAAVVPNGLSTRSRDAARHWLRIVPMDGGESSWDPPIDLVGLVSGRTEAMVAFATEVRSRGHLMGVDEADVRPFLAGLVWLAQYAAAGEPAAWRPFATSVRLAVDMATGDAW